jgi:hypothetical protein
MTTLIADGLERVDKDAAMDAGIVSTFWNNKFAADVASAVLPPALVASVVKR